MFQKSKILKTRNFKRVYCLCKFIFKVQIFKKIKMLKVKVSSVREKYSL